MKLSNKKNQKNTFIRRNYFVTRFMETFETFVLHIKIFSHHPQLKLLFSHLQTILNLYADPT
jgi:hypothetical protein